MPSKKTYATAAEQQAAEQKKQEDKARAEVEKSCNRAKGLSLIATKWSLTGKKGQEEGFAWEVVEAAATAGEEAAVFMGEKNRAVTVPDDHMAPLVVGPANEGESDRDAAWLKKDAEERRMHLTSMRVDADAAEDIMAAVVTKLTTEQRADLTRARQLQHLKLDERRYAVMKKGAAEKAKKQPEFADDEPGDVSANFYTDAEVVGRHLFAYVDGSKDLNNGSGDNAKAVHLPESGLFLSRGDALVAKLAFGIDVTDLPATPVERVKLWNSKVRTALFVVADRPITATLVAATDSAPATIDYVASDAVPSDFVADSKLPEDPVVGIFYSLDVSTLVKRHCDATVAPQDNRRIVPASDHVLNVWNVVTQALVGAKYVSKRVVDALRVTANKRPVPSLIKAAEYQSRFQWQEPVFGDFSNEEDRRACIDSVVECVNSWRGARFMAPSIDVLGTGHDPVRSTLVFSEGETGGSLAAGFGQCFSAAGVHDGINVEDKKALATPGGLADTRRMLAPVFTAAGFLAANIAQFPVITDADGVASTAPAARGAKRTRDGRAKKAKKGDVDAEALAAAVAQALQPLMEKQAKFRKQVRARLGNIERSYDRVDSIVTALAMSGPNPMDMSELDNMEAAVEVEEYESEIGEEEA